MQQTIWKELSERYPDRTLIRDPAAYADVFTAIDEAQHRAAGVQPSPDECEVIGYVPAEGAGDEESVNAMLAWRTPVVPVRVPNTVRLCIGLLQYYHWPVLRSADGACLPHVDTLLKRKLRPMLEEAVDLAAFLIVRVGSKDQEEDYTWPSATILNLIERNFDPPVPRPLAAVLREARRRVEVSRVNYVNLTRRHGGRPQTKRFDRWVKRLDRLLGS